MVTGTCWYSIIHKNLSSRLKLGSGFADAKITRAMSILDTAGLISSFFRGSIRSTLPMCFSSSRTAISTDIAYQWLYLLFSEGAFCFALVESAACGSFFCFFGFFYVDVVEAGNSFNNFSCHGFPCVLLYLQESRFRRGACRALRLCGWRGQAYIPLKKYEASPGLSYGQAMACSALFFPR